MKKAKTLMLAILPLIATTISSCGDKDLSNSSTNDTKTSVNSAIGGNEPSYSFSQDEDTTKLIPEEVLNANLEIDFAIYVEGQNRIIKDIGNYSPDPTDMSRKYHPVDISSIELAEFFGAAWAFKKIAPNVKINLMYCSINEYNEMIRSYYEQYGHFPQAMRATDTVFEMLENGYSYDLNHYADSEYLNSYNEYFLSRFNYGGFQAAVPVAAHPWGIFVNLDALEDFNVVLQTQDPLTGQATEEYMNWVDNFTWDSFMDAARKSNTESHAAVSKMCETFASYSIASINDKFIREGTVDLTSADVTPTIQKILNYENELSQMAVYEYNSEQIGNLKKEAFPNAASWRGVENFVKDEYSTFYGEAPWALKTISTFVTSSNEQGKNDPNYIPLNPRIDYIPYPKVDESSFAYTGEAIGGITIGNQCPVGVVCTVDRQLSMDVAAYFSMFMNLDPRAIDGRSKVKYVFDNREYTGSLELPLTKRGVKFSFQENPEDDPAVDFDDNWQYHMSLWFKNYDLYVTNDEPADVRYFTNITYGLVKMLDSVFMLDGIGDNYVTCLNYYNEPVNIPGSDDEVVDIFNDWTSRFTLYSNDEGAGNLGTDTYASSVMASLKDIENKINTNSAIAWSYLQECVDEYYGEGLYDVSDKSYRNSYEGSNL